VVALRISTDKRASRQLDAKSVSVPHLTMPEGEIFQLASVAVVPRAQWSTGCAVGASCSCACLGVPPVRRSARAGA
jgi:hypothetical protein